MTPIETMASFESDFTESEILAANLSHLSQVQITSLTTTAAAHVAAVKASIAAKTAANDLGKAKSIAENAEKTAVERRREYEIEAGKGQTTAAAEEAKKAAKLAADQLKAAKDEFRKANEAATNASRAASEAIAKADKAECDNAKVVLYSDLSPQVARTVRMFGSGMIQDRTLSGDNFHPDLFVTCYSLLSKFILALNETPSLEMFVSPKREDVLKLIVSLERYGFNGKWLTDVRYALTFDFNLISENSELQEAFDMQIEKSRGMIRDLQVDLMGYTTLSKRVQSHGVALRSRFPPFFSTKPPKQPTPNQPTPNQPPPNQPPDNTPAGSQVVNNA